MAVPLRSHSEHTKIPNGLTQGLQQPSTAGLCRRLDRSCGAALDARVGPRAALRLLTASPAGGALPLLPAPAPARGRSARRQPRPAGCSAERRVPPPSPGQPMAEAAGLR